MDWQVVEGGVGERYDSIQEMVQNEGEIHTWTDEFAYCESISFSL